MRRYGLPLMFVIIALFVVYRFFIKRDPKKERVKPQAISIDENSGQFNQSYQKLLSSYYAVKDALAESDTIKTNAAAKELVTYADSLKVNEIQGDSSGLIKETALNYAGTISGSARGLLGEKDIIAKRREFEMISDALWSLTRTVKYSGEKVYYLYCPMAFNNQGAYWLSNNSEIRNPYFGNEMLDCGTVEDSVDYSKK